MKKINIETWKRRDHFKLFSKFEEPFFGATVEIDCTKAYQTAKNLKTSFFIFYLHKTLAAVNSVENFKYRIAENQIYIHDRVDASATIGRKDDTFGFSLIEYNPDFKIKEIEYKPIEGKFGYPMKFLFHYEKGKLSKMIAEGMQTTFYEYDKNGNRTKEIQKDLQKNHA